MMFFQTVIHDVVPFLPTPLTLPAATRGVKEAGWG